MHIINLNRRRGVNQVLLNEAVIIVLAQLVPSERYVLLKQFRAGVNNVLKLEVDENDPANRSPRQSLEPEEEIEVVLKKRGETRAFFEEEQRRGTYIDVVCWFIFCC